MLCPVMSNQASYRSDKNCIEKECALYNKHTSQCSYNTEFEIKRMDVLIETLSKIRKELTAIQIKMRNI